MAKQKKCSATLSFVGWTLVSGTCIYNLTVVIDGVPITNAIAINNTMTAIQIQNLLNTNRIGNTTGTFVVAIVGNALEITLIGIVIPSGDAGNYLASLTTGSPFPCASFLGQQTIMTCTVVPSKKGGIGSFALMQQQMCFKRKRDAEGNLIPCPEKVNYLGRQIYTKISEDNYKCCYRKGDIK